MGVLAPTMRELGAHFTAMQSALEEKASEFNYLGGTTSLVAGDGRTSGNTILNTMYFRDRESVARFSASGVHMVSLLGGLCESFEEANRRRTGRLELVVQSETGGSCGAQGRKGWDWGQPVGVAWARGV